MTKASFSPSTVIFLAAAATALLAASLLLGAYEDDHISTGGRAGPGAYSLSAIGHAGLYDTLRRLGWNVSREAGNILAKAGGRGTVVVAEPDPRYMDSDFEITLAKAPRLFLVLPKWTGKQDSGRSAWIKSVEPLPLGRSRGVLNLVDAGGEVARSSWPEAWAVNQVGIQPIGGKVVQLMLSDAMRPVVASADGMLVGEIRHGDRVIWVLSDPDVMANHGIVRGDNAGFMTELLTAFAGGGPGGRPLVFDENVHGFQLHRGSLLRLLFRLPYAAILILVCLLIGVTLYAAVGRFGAPRRPKPNLDFGKAGLIANGARLLEQTGNLGEPLLRYIHMTLRLVAAELHAPPGLTPTAQAGWLRHIEEARRASVPVAAILRTAEGAVAGGEPDIPRLRTCARAIHRWKGEMLDGSGTDRRHRQ